MLHFKKHYKQYIPFLLASCTFFISLIFKNNPEITEKLYSRNLYPVIATLLSGFSGLFPFSIDDVFYVSLILLLIVGLVIVLLKKKTIVWLIIKMLQGVAIIYFIFYWFWGFNYFRQDAHHRLGIEKSEPDNELFIEVFNLVIEETNNSYTSFVGKDTVNYQSKLEPAIEKLKDVLNVSYPNGNRRIKNILFSDFFAKASILGYYGPFFNEVHVNSYLSVWDKPIVTAHEMSHQLGVTSEGEANFYAWMITVNSDDRFANYSGWLYALGFFLYQSKDLENRKEMIQKIKPEVVADYKARRQYWQKRRSKKIDNAARKVNDAYLKSNNVKKGVADYGGMVQLIIDFYLSDKDNKVFKE